MNVIFYCMHHLLINFEFLVPNFLFPECRNVLQDQEKKGMNGWCNLMVGKNSYVG